MFEFDRDKLFALRAPKSQKVSSLCTLYFYLSAIKFQAAFSEISAASDLMGNFSSAGKL